MQIVDCELIVDDFEYIFVTTIYHTTILMVHVNYVTFNLAD